MGKTKQSKATLMLKLFVLLAAFIAVAHSAACVKIDSMCLGVPNAELFARYQAYDVADLRAVLRPKNQGDILARGNLNLNLLTPADGFLSDSPLSGEAIIGFALHTSDNRFFIGVEAEGFAVIEVSRDMLRGRARAGTTFRGDVLVLGEFVQTGCIVTAVDCQLFDADFAQDISLGIAATYNLPPSPPGGLSSGST